MMLNATYSNVRTSALFGCKENLNLVEKAYMYKLAFQLAEDGLIVFIICREPLQEIPLELERLTLATYPEILERINFRYLASLKDVINWCHEVQHYKKNKPNALFVQRMDEYMCSEKFDLFRTFAALTDAAHYCSISQQGNLTYLVISILLELGCSDLYNFRFFLSLFETVWKVGKNEEQLFLDQRANKTHKVAMNVKFNRLPCGAYDFSCPYKCLFENL